VSEASLGSGVFGPFDVISVTTLPAPHNPFRCEHFDRFKSFLAELPALETREDWSDYVERNQEAGWRFDRSLGPGDLALCSRHAGRWHTIAEAAVNAVRNGGASPTIADIEAAQSAGGVSEKDAAAYWSLFRCPIAIEFGMFTNGQHRACAIRHSGAAELTVARRP
jgi:hypothetical protein